jgi:GNAT superfamily N-acetyltransferase
MKTASIRLATLSDLDSILLLSDELTLSDLPYDTEVAIDWAHTADGKTYYTEKIIGKKGICFVAEVKKKIVGYLTASEKDIPTYRLVKVAEIENVIVTKRMRGQGIGKILLQHFTTWAKKIGAKKISVNVFSLNAKGIAFYKHNGFTPFETILEMPLV